MAALLEETYAAFVVESEGTWLPKINSVPWDLLLQWCMIHSFLPEVRELAVASDLPRI
jgi:hypothetical protein